MGKEESLDSIFKPSLKINSIHENSIEYIRWLIQTIEAYDLKKSYDILYNYLGNLLNQVPAMHLSIQIPVAKFDHENPRDSISCVRLRKIENLSDIVSDNDFWARSKSEVKTYGRCHSPEQQVLYCSSSLGVALYELDLKKDEKFIAILYNSKVSKKPIDLIALGEERSVFEDNVITNPYKKSIYKNLSKKNREKLATIEKFITKHFRKKIGISDVEKYKITSAIVKFYFNEPCDMVSVDGLSVKMGGVIYPSVKVGGTAYNFAFKDDYAREHLVVSEVISGKVLDFSPAEGYSVRFDHRLTRNGYNGSFKWDSL